MATATRGSKAAVLATGPSGKTRVFASQTAASKSLSGTGSTRLQRKISSVLAAGGGYVGNTYVERG